jgi:hypothetical protein
MISIIAEVFGALTHFPKQIDQWDIMLNQAATAFTHTYFPIPYLLHSSSLTVLDTPMYSYIGEGVSNYFSDEFHLSKMHPFFF